MDVRVTHPHWKLSVDFILKDVEKVHEKPVHYNLHESSTFYYRSADCYIADPHFVEVLVKDRDEHGNYVCIMS